VDARRLRHIARGFQEGAEAAALIDSLPRSWSDWNEADWLRAAAAVKVRIHEDRLEFPRSFPFYIGWNKQFSNVPGSTIFLPVVDCTRQYINILLIVLSEPDGQRPIVIDDWQPFRPRSWADWKAWIGGHLGLAVDHGQRFHQLPSDHHGTL
jgi:hypothetical protein